MLITLTTHINNAAINVEVIETDMLIFKSEVKYINTFINL
jgi:hypothetical protein